MNSSNKILFKRPKESARLLLFCMIIGTLPFFLFLFFFVFYGEFNGGLLLAGIIAAPVFFILPSYQFFINIPRYIRIDKNHIVFVHYFFLVDIEHFDIQEMTLEQTSTKGIILTINYTGGIKKLSSNQWNNYFSKDDLFAEIIDALKNSGYLIRVDKK